MRILAVVVLLALCVHTVHAQEAESYEFWPELHVYYRLSNTERLFFLVAPTRERDKGIRDVQLGANIDIGLSPFIRGVWDSTLDDAPGFRYLRFRAGVRYLASVDPERPYQEWRGVAEVTPLLPIGNLGTFYLRNRAEFRWISGDYAFRYRVRIRFDKQFNPFGAGNVSLSPGASAEAYWDSRSPGVSRLRYQAGLSVGLTNMFAIEPEINYQQSLYPLEQSVFALGLVFVFFF